MATLSEGNQSECTCGNNFTKKKNQADGSSTLGYGQIDLDSSFVHLPLSSPSDNNEETKLTPATFSTAYSHLLMLESVANNELSQDGLCLECVDRIRDALDLDTDRLEAECHMYREAVKEDRRRHESTMRALRGFWPGDESSNFSALLQNYMNEIEGMKANCRSQVAEVKELVRLRKEQTQLSLYLDELEWSVEEHRNALELEARGFDNVEEQTRKQLSETIAELDRLSAIQIRLPEVVLDLKVDKERGLRYPLINELRLAFRTKGDVDKAEIQAAWALAAQLLLVCGTLLQFQSQSWKIVPLSSGAKLIHHDHKRPPASSSSTNEKDFTVYNLGHPKSHGPQTLLAWNQLMQQVVQHALGVLTKTNKEGLVEVHSSLPKLPFDMAPMAIGGINLLQLDANDDAGWSRAIHFIASNLLWLSECASRCVLVDVQLLAQV